MTDQNQEATTEAQVKALDIYSAEAHTQTER